MRQNTNEMHQVTNGSDGVVDHMIAWFMANATDRYDKVEFRI